MANFPFGGLVSFCGLQFDTTRSTYASNFSLEWATSFVPLPDAAFPADLWYGGPAPLKNPEATWVYLLLGCIGTSTNTTVVIEQEYGDIMTALMSPTGQKGDLVVTQMAGGTLKCKARIMSAPLKLTPGKNSSFYMLELKFCLLSPWS